MPAVADLSAASPTPHPSPGVLLVLLLILGASVWVFTTLVRRETKNRRRVALAQWARLRNLRLGKSSDHLARLAALEHFEPRVLHWIDGGGMTLAQIETADSGLTAVAAAKRRWHIMLHDLKNSWPASALRPTARAVSVVDLFSLSSYPSLMPTDRFMVFGTEARSARTLAESSAAALLPPDIALIVAGKCLILDFSTRHFDEIEFDRIIDLAEQLAPRLAYPG
jgi:hypothetical protein